MRNVRLPEHACDVKDSADEDDDHGDEEDYEEYHKSPCVTRRDVTHSLYRRTADVTRICAHVTDAAAVAVFLNSQNYNVMYVTLSKPIQTEPVVGFGGS